MSDHGPEEPFDPEREDESVHDEESEPEPETESDEPAQDDA